MNATEVQVPDWRPLEANVPLNDRPNYKHRDTRRYLNIDVDCVRFFIRKDTGELAEADRETAFGHVHCPDQPRG